MIMGNVSERRKQPPQVGVSVVILALGPASHGTQEHARTSAGSTLWIPLVRRVRQPFLGQWALPGGGLRADHSLEQSAYVALESTTSLHPRYLEQLYTFGDPARSHGGLPMVSIVYWALVDDLNGQLGPSGGASSSRLPPSVATARCSRRWSSAPPAPEGAPRQSMRRGSASGAEMTPGRVVAATTLPAGFSAPTNPNAAYTSATYTVFLAYSPRGTLAQDPKGNP